MDTLLLLMAAPMQSWGVRSASPRKRDTAAHPSRSGVVGLLAACQGLGRTVSPISWSRDMEICVRIDRPGQVLHDFHTTGGGARGAARLRTASGKYRDNASVSERDYLTDAAFVVAVGGEPAQIARLAAAVDRPRFTPFLGRKSCPPGLRLLLGIFRGTPREALACVPAYHQLQAGNSHPVADTATTNDVTFDDFAIAAKASAIAEQPPVACRVIFENPVYATDTLNDKPLSFDHWNRTYGARPVGEDIVNITAAGTGLPGFVAMRAALSEGPR